MRAALIGAAIALVACAPPESSTSTWAAAAPTSPPPPNPTPAPPSTPPPTSTPAPPPSALPAPLVRATVHEPAGAAPLSPEGETVVDAAASFEVELQGRVPDARLVLLDAADAHVPATYTREVGETTRLTLAPVAPLVPAARHVLRLEGVAEREMHDASGRAYAPSSFALLVAGTPPPPEPKRKPKRRRR